MVQLTHCVSCEAMSLCMGKKVKREGSINNWYMHLNLSRSITLMSSLNKHTIFVIIIILWYWPPPALWIILMTNHCSQQLIFFLSSFRTSLLGQLLPLLDLFVLRSANTYTQMNLFIASWRNLFASILCGMVTFGGVCVCCVSDNTHLQISQNGDLIKPVSPPLPRAEVFFLRFEIP